MALRDTKNSAYSKYLPFPHTDQLVDNVRNILKNYPEDLMGGEFTSGWRNAGCLVVEVVFFFFLV